MQKEFISRVPLLKVMFLTDMLDGMGGAERSLYLLTKELKLRGHEITVCCLKGGTLSQQMHNEGFNVENLDIERIYSLDGIKAFLKLNRIIREQGISVIFSSHESSDFIGVFLSLVTGVPIVSSRRDMGYQLKKRHILFYRLINRFFDHIHTVSGAVKDYVVKVQFAKPAKITAIHNGVVEQTDKDSVELPIPEITYDGHIKICCLANVRPIKGHDFLIDSLKYVIDKYPEVRIYFVGQFDSESSYHQTLLSKIKQKGLLDSIIFTGPVDNSQIPQLLKLMDIIVLPSRSEGMPNVLLEAMVAGKPVVATNVGGVPEIVEDGKTGFLVPYGNPELMSNKLNELVIDKKLREQMGREGRILVETKFSVKVMVDKYEDLLQYIYMRKGPLKSTYALMESSRKLSSFTNFLKICFASIIFYSGVLKIFLWLKKIFKLGKAKILALHDINNCSLIKIYSGICVVPDNFNKMIDYIYKQYRIASLEEVISLKKNIKPLQSDIYALTFDDCYMGWHNFVMPKCQELHIPYTLFINTGPLDAGEVLLYDKIVYMFENTWRKIADFTKWEIGLFFLDNPYNINLAINSIHENLKSKTDSEQNKILSYISEYLSVTDNTCLNDIILKWPHLKKIHENGGSIGAHGISHADLGKMEKSLYINEIIMSKRRLEEELEDKVKYFAYPFGGRNNYNTGVIETLIEAGLKNAVILGESAGPDNDYTIGRISVNSGMFCYRHSYFSKALLAVELSGLGNYLFLRFNRKI